MARTLLLLDGDQFLHRACAAVESETKWDEENWVLSSNEIEAYEVVEGSIQKVLNHFGSTDTPILCLSDTDKIDFRKQIDKTYKAHRANMRKPICFYPLKEKMKQEYTCRFFPGLEADDVMGILATKPGPDNKIIVSRDKDLRTIPTKVWNGLTFYNISEAEADYFHLYQTLIGDASDGYKGAHGIGPKKAEKILEAEDKWSAVVEAFIKAGQTAEDALRQARLARILRWSDWDASKKEPKLWLPG